MLCSGAFDSVGGLPQYIGNKTFMYTFLFRDGSSSSKGVHLKTLYKTRDVRCGSVFVHVSHFLSRVLFFSFFAIYWFWQKLCFVFIHILCTCILTAGMFFELEKHCTTNDIGTLWMAHLSLVKFCDKERNYMVLMTHYGGTCAILLEHFCKLALFV